MIVITVKNQTHSRADTTLALEKITAITQTRLHSHSSTHMDDQGLTGTVSTAILRIRFTNVFFGLRLKSEMSELSWDTVQRSGSAKLYQIEITHLDLPRPFSPLVSKWPRPGLS